MKKQAQKQEKRDARGFFLPELKQNTSKSSTAPSKDLACDRLEIKIQTGLKKTPKPNLLVLKQ